MELDCRTDVGVMLTSKLIVKEGVGVKSVILLLENISMVDDTKLIVGLVVVNCTSEVGTGLLGDDVSLVMLTMPLVVMVGTNSVLNNVEITVGLDISLVKSKLLVMVDTTPMVVGVVSKLDVKVASRLDVTSTVDDSISLVITLVVIVGTISVVKINVFTRLDDKLSIVVGVNSPVSEVNKIVVRLVMLDGVGDIEVNMNVVLVNSALEIMGVVSILDIEVVITISVLDGIEDIEITLVWVVFKANVVVGNGEINSLLVLNRVVGNTVNDVVRVRNDALVVFGISSMLEETVGVGNGVTLVSSVILLRVITVGTIVILDVGVTVTTRLCVDTTDTTLPKVGDTITLVKSMPPLLVIVGVTVSTIDIFVDVNNTLVVSADEAGDVTMTLEVGV